MAIVLTNSLFYIALNKNGGVIKVREIEKAQNFYSVELALRQLKKTPGRCAGYYCVDTEAAKNGEKEAHALKNGAVEGVCLPKKTKRKIFSAQERVKIYRKTEGHCYLCGEFVDFNSFEIEHKVPLAKGGSNDPENLFCSCHCCNMIKQDIYPEDFMEKVTQIFLYQLRQRSEESLKWKMIYHACKQYSEKER